MACSAFYFTFRKSNFSLMSKPIKYYLAAYNFVAFSFWLAYLLFYITSGMELSPINLVLLNIAQGMAVLEILHVVLRWVKSPVGSTIVQVFSRLLILVLINVFLQEHAGLFLFAMGVKIVSLAWGITELVRYSFYFFSLFNQQPKTLLWMRYSFFIVLYPLGVTGEWFILGTPVAAKGIALNGYNIFLLISAASYVYYFPVLYKYMWKQRRERL